jgi:hypothetical protein
MMSPFKISSWIAKWTGHRLRNVSHWIRSKEDLKDVLSTPNPEDAASFRQLEGDRVISGVGSQIGPSLARPAGRDAQAAGAKMRIIGTAVHCGALAPGPLVEAGVKIQCVNLLDPSSFRCLARSSQGNLDSCPEVRLDWGREPDLGDERPRAGARRLPEWQYLMPVVSGVATEAIAPEPLARRG